MNDWAIFALLVVTSINMWVHDYLNKRIDLLHKQLDLVSKSNTNTHNFLMWLVERDLHLK